MNPQSFTDWLLIGFAVLVASRFALWLVAYTHAYWVMRPGPQRDGALKRLTE